MQEPAAAEVAPAPADQPPPPLAGRSLASESRASDRDALDHPLIGPSDPLANLAVRVRRPLDKRLGFLVYKLGEDEVRTSKAELIEMLLWELPGEPTNDFRRRLAAFRRAAPRETPV